MIKFIFCLCFISAFYGCNLSNSSKNSTKATNTTNNTTTNNSNASANNNVANSNNINEQEKVNNYIYVGDSAKPYIHQVFKDKKFENLPSNKIKPQDSSFIFVRADNDRFGGEEIKNIIAKAKPSQNIFFIRIIANTSTVHGQTNMQSFINHVKSVSGYENANINFVFITRAFTGDLDQTELNQAIEKINKLYKK